MATVIGWHALKGCTVTCGNKYSPEPARPEWDKTLVLHIPFYLLGELKAHRSYQATSPETYQQCQRGTNADKDLTHVKIAKNRVKSYNVGSYGQTHESQMSNKIIFMKNTARIPSQSTREQMSAHSKMMPGFYWAFQWRRQKFDTLSDLVPVLCILI